MTKTSFAVVLALGAIAGVAGARPDRAAPVVETFSPAAVHPGDAMLIRARNVGSARPRVWIGERRVRTPDVRVESADDDGAQRVWARVPKRMPLGSFEVKLATRAGRTAAAKPIVVASCNPHVPTIDCDHLPSNHAAKLAVTGPGGYSRVIDTKRVEPETVGNDTIVTACSNQAAAECGERFAIRIPLALDAVVVGDVATVEAKYRDAQGQDWSSSFPGPTVRVLSATSKRVAFCIDVTLPAFGAQDPSEVTVQGYVVVDLPAKRAGTR